MSIKKVDDLTIDELNRAVALHGQKPILAKQFLTTTEKVSMKVKIKKLNSNAVMPKYAKNGDAGLDLVAISCEHDEQGMKTTYKTGLAFEIPSGYVGLIFPRSSIRDTVLSLTNCVGVIDSGYRGEVSFTFRVHDTGGECFAKMYRPGERIGQMIIMPYPTIELEEVSELSDSERGTGGFGSSGQ